MARVRFARTDPIFEPASDTGRKINGKQVSLLEYLWSVHTRERMSLLEFLEFECGVNVTKLEEIPDHKMAFIVAKLRGEA